MRSLKIALADDDDGVRAVLAMWLTKLGHVVVPVGGGRALAELCRCGEFDLAVSDVDMPDGDGITAADTVRRECGLPVLLMSGGWTHELALQAREAGAMCLDKPVLPLVLVANIEEACGRRELAAV